MNKSPPILGVISVNPAEFCNLMACYYELNHHGAEISCGSFLTSGLVLSALDAAYLSVLQGGFWDWHGHGLHLSSRLWFMVLVWTLVVDPITRLVLLVSTLTVSVRIGRLSLLKPKTKHFRELPTQPFL